MSTPAIDYESIAKQYGGEPAQDYASVAKQYGGEPLAPPAAAPQQDIHAIAAQHGGLPLTAAGPEDMSTVAGAIPGTKTPQQVAGVQPGLPAPTKAQGAREGWMPGETERQQVKPVTDFLNKPLLGPDTSTDQGKLAEQEAQSFDQGKLAEQEAQSFRKAHPIAGGVVSGIQNTIQGMTTPANLAMLAVLPESKIISAFFAAQAAHGAYNSAEDAYQAFREGKNSEAAQYITEAGLNGLMAGLAGYHAASTHATPTSETSQPTETSQNVPPGLEFRRRIGWNRGTFAESSPETNPTTDETKPAIGEAEPETGRPVLQQSEHPEVNQAAAKAEHQIVKSQIEDAIEPIEGAEVSGARAEKTLDRIEEKIDEEGQSPKTVRDYSGYRIAVDTPEAKNQVVKALKDRFEVPDEQDEFEKGNDETGFHGHTLQVREPGSPVSHEVQILPREVADSANSRHDLYEKAREGDKDAAAQMKAANEADWQRFSERNLKGPQPMSASKTAGSVPEREAVNRNPAGGAANPPIIDPARAEEYRNSPEMKGAEFPVNSITISNRNGKQVEVPLKGTGGEDAVRVGRPEEVLQREPGQAGETGGERGRVEPIKQGEGPARAQKAGETAVQPTDREFQKGSRVRLKDGQTGTVQYFQPEVNGGQAVARVRLDSGVMRKSVQASDMRPEAAEPETKGKQWIGVDLDGTLAKYDGFKGPTVIGEPIPAMVDRVRQWLAEGKNVKILTARVSEDASGVAKRAIQDWAEKNLGQRIDVTDVKDAHMVHLYDDRAVPVERNTGRLLGQPQPEESNVVRQTTVPEGNTETTGNAERPTPEETVRRKPGERGVDTELSEARRLGKQSSDKVLADAQARNAVENIARARIETTTLKDIGNAKVTVLNPDAYHFLVKLLTPEDDWKGAALDPGTASRWIAKIRSMESRLRQLGTMKPAAEAAKALALDLDKAREADGSLLLLRSDYDEPTVREELAHRWQNQAGLRDSEAIRELTNRPEFEQINDRLKSMGYDLSPEDQASELLAKAMAGDPDMEWSLAQQKEVVSAGLKALVDEHGPSILENLPPTDPAIKSAIEEVKTYAKDKVRGNEREASERLGGERGGEARADRGQRGGTVDQGKPSAGASGERGVQKGGAKEDKLGRFKKLASYATGDADRRKTSEKTNKDTEREGAMQGQPLFKRAESATTVTTGKHDTGKSLDELIEDLAKAPKRSMSMEERIESASDYGLRSIAGVGDKLNQTWAKVKGSTAGISDSWNHTSPWTNFFESLKGLRQAEFRTALDLDAYQKELKRTAPSEREREAMTIYGEAANDQELRRWASQADNLPDKRWSNAFKDATDLTPQQKAIATAHRKYYDQQLRVLTDSGLLPAGATRYVMHMFTSDPQSLHQLRSVTDFSELATDPSFLKRRVYKNYFEAIANGEKPKTLDAGLILGAYHDAFAKTFMTRSFLRSLLYAADEDDGRPLAAIQSRAGWTMLDKDQAGEARILKQPKRPEDLTGYKVIPASQLRNFTWELTDADREILAPGYKDMPKDEQAKLFGPDDPRFPVPAGKTLAIKGDLLIHPKYADRVSDLVTKSWFDRSDSKVAAALKGIQKAGALAKSVVLSGSLFHQVQLGVHAMEHLVNPFKLPELKALAKDPVVLEGVGHGLNLLSVDAEGVLSDLPGMAAYHRYLFRDYIPRLKAQMYKHAFDRNLNRYSGKLTRDEIHLMTAKQANSAFGGLDPAFFEKLNFQSNRTYKAIEHMVLFSPDFTKARAQFVAQGFGKYGQEQRMALIRGALVIYVGARIANAILNNGDAKWKPQDALSVVTPKSWGPEKRISLRTVQGDLMEVVTDPEHFSYNRINPVTLKPTIEFLTGRDNFGRQESKEHFLKDYVKQLTPIPVQKLFTTSDEGILSSLFTSAGLQTGNYRTPLEQMAHKLRIENIPDKPESEEKQDEGRRNVQMVQKIREGKATTADLWNLVNQGKMTPREASAVMDRAQMTELQYDVHHLSLDDAMKIYAKADNSERAELHDILEEKRASGLKNMTDEAAEKVDKQLKELGIE